MLLPLQARLTYLGLSNMTSRCTRPTPEGAAVREAAVAAAAVCAWAAGGSAAELRRTPPPHESAPSTSGAYLGRRSNLS